MTKTALQLIVYSICNRYSCLRKGNAQCRWHPSSAEIRASQPVISKIILSWINVKLTEFFSRGALFFAFWHIYRKRVLYLCRKSTSRWTISAYCPNRGRRSLTKMDRKRNVQSSVWTVQSIQIPDYNGQAKYNRQILLHSYIILVLCANGMPWCHTYITYPLQGMPCCPLSSARRPSGRVAAESAKMQ